MKNSKVSHLITLAVVIGSVCAGSAFGDAISVFNTGEGSGGSALAVGQTDTHFTLLSAPAGVALTAIATSAYPTWTGNLATADWISPGSDGATSWPVGTYDYQTTFDLGSLLPSTAMLSGQWTSDNNACIVLNGANTGICSVFEGFGSPSNYSITSGFRAGVNTLDFVVDNGGGPSGLLATIGGTASAAASSSDMPEPASLLLTGIALVGLGGVLLRKRLCS